MTSFTPEDRRKKLLQMQSRVQNLGLFGTAGPQGANLGAHLASKFKEALELTDEQRRENDKRVGELFRAAHSGDLTARSQLYELLVEQTNNFVTAGSDWIRFFEVRTLAPNQSPAIQNNTRQEITARYIGQDTGKAEITKVIRPQHETLVDLYVLSSDQVEYRLRDLYTGNIEEAAKSTFDIAFDLAQKIETLLDPETGFLSGAIGAFDTTNTNKARRTYHTHSRIVASNLPTTNSLSITGVGASTKFGFSALDEIIDYCVRFKGTNPLGELMPTGEIIVPVRDVREILDGFSVTGAKQNDKINEVAINGWLDIGTYGGLNWKVVPSQTIARKALYARLNRPVGIFWTKPDWNMVEEKVDRMKNIASRQEATAIGAAIPTPNAVNIVKVAYRT